MQLSLPDDHIASAHLDLSSVIVTRRPTVGEPPLTYRVTALRRLTGKGPPLSARVERLVDLSRDSDKTAPALQIWAHDVEASRMETLHGTTPEQLLSSVITKLCG